MNCDPTKAIRVLDLMLELFDGGRSWEGAGIYGEGRYCVQTALDFVTRINSLPLDDALHYLLIAMAMPDDGNIYHLRTVNDRCRKYSEIEEIVMQARDHALADSSALAEVSA
jgi:hypothetical protein